ncbi:hypothetical protein KR093_005326 [Drosophila rubida]|uniref:Uncharacterized protein n=1 Tax=Drosophila rubida TaxID=30044 RepID=A0AAD4JTD1_9MUSC|nr:hypothetical protein KR093_005326 [Drosophila rubida]
MLRVDLKALLQISQATPGAFRMHKRVQLTGNVSYMVCFEVLDGQMTIKQARRVKLTRSAPRTQRQQKVLPIAEPTAVVSVPQTLPIKQDDSTQTLELDRSNANVDTQDLRFHISRYQQTPIRHYASTGSQTKQLHLVVCATQIEVSMKTKCTQIQQEPKIIAEVNTQTEALLPCRNSCTQTTFEEDETALMSPHLELLHLLLRTSSGQGQLLMRSVEAINQLVEFKALELQRERLDDDEDTSEVKQLYSKSPRLRCAKIRGRPKPGHQREQTKTDREQLEPQPTACKWTQTEQLKMKVAGNIVTTTKQRDRDKGFLWLRRSN